MNYVKHICSNCKHYKTCKEPCAFVQKLLNESEGICDQCPHKETCTKPCFLADCFINENVKPLFEKTTTQVRGGQEIQITVIYDPYCQKTSNFAEVTTENEEGKARSDVDNVSAGDMERFYNGVFYVRSQKLGIFIDHFFNGFTYEDLAVKYETTAHQAMKVYERAKTDFLSFLDAWNREKEVLRNRMQAEAHLQNLGKMPKKLKCFLLHYVFELSYSDISELLNVPRNHISREIKSVEANIKEGINPLQFEDGKIRASTSEEIRQQRGYQPNTKKAV